MDDNSAFDLELPGWTLAKSDQEMTVWQDVDGDALTLVPETGPLDITKNSELRRQCRSLAESMKSGLVEANIVTRNDTPAATLIYKRLEKPAFIFTGLLQIASPDGPQFWTIVARERGTTGVREATVTAQLFEQGKLTIESYEESWAKDPYDEMYTGVDRSTLRYISDDQKYDAQFPNHPLSKVRRVLNDLLERSAK